jgi:hypothetical protein
MNGRWHKQDHSIQITEGVIAAAVRNERFGKGMMEVLLAKRGDVVQGPESVIIAPTRDKLSRKEISAF